MARMYELDEAYLRLKNKTHIMIKHEKYITNKE